MASIPSTRPTVGLTTDAKVYRSAGGRVMCEITVMNHVASFVRVPRFPHLQWEQVTDANDARESIEIYGGGFSTTFDGGTVQLGMNEGFTCRRPLDIGSVPMTVRFRLKVSYSAYRKSDVPPPTMISFVVHPDGTVGQ